MSKEILRMGGGRIINIGQINKLVQKATTERMSEYDSGSIQDALSSMCEDPRLSDDPLNALKAFCEHHLIELEHEGLSILSNGVQVFYSECGPTSADDIKPEQ